MTASQSFDMGATASGPVIRFSPSGLLVGGLFGLVALAGKLTPDTNLGLVGCKLIFDLERTLAKLSGHQGEPAPVKAPSVDPVSSLPPRP